jgi:hypothetical protein
VLLLLLERVLTIPNSSFCRSVQVVQGRYPARLLQARTERRKETDETSQAPDAFPVEQMYAGLVLDNGGEDLECYEDLTWKQAASIFCQIVDALALAETAHQFEHRDLHWGNVVIAPVEEAAALSSLKKGQEADQLKDPKCSGVKVTIIDYTLSRATIDGKVTANPFEDESLFEGQGESGVERRGLLLTGIAAYQANSFSQVTCNLIFTCK